MRLWSLHGSLLVASTMLSCSLCGTSSLYELLKNDLKHNTKTAIDFVNNASDAVVIKAALAYNDHTKILATVLHCAAFHNCIELIDTIFASKAVRSHCNYEMLKRRWQNNQLDTIPGLKKYKSDAYSKLQAIISNGVLASIFESDNPQMHESYNDLESILLSDQLSTLFEAEKSQSNFFMPYLNIPDAAQCSAFYMACSYGKISIVEKILQKCTPEDIQKLLQQKGPDGRTALHSAVLKNQHELINLFCSSDKITPKILRKSFSVRDAYNNTPFHYACSLGRSTIVQSIVNKKRFGKKRLKILLKQRGEGGLTPLHCAFLYDKAKIVQALKQKSKTTNEQSIADTVYPLTQEERQDWQKYLANRQNFTQTFEHYVASFDPEQKEKEFSSTIETCIEKLERRKALLRGDTILIKTLLADESDSLFLDDCIVGCTTDSFTLFHSNLASDDFLYQDGQGRIQTAEVIFSCFNAQPKQLKEILHFTDQEGESVLLAMQKRGRATIVEDQKGQRTVRRVNNNGILTPQNGFIVSGKLLNKSDEKVMKLWHKGLPEKITTQQALLKNTAHQDSPGTSTWVIGFGLAAAVFGLVSISGLAYRYRKSPLFCSLAEKLGVAIQEEDDHNDDEQSNQENKETVMQSQQNDFGKEVGILIKKAYKTV